MLSGEPEFEHDFGIGACEIFRELILQLCEQLVLHRLDIGKTQESPRFLRRAVDVDCDFHGVIFMAWCSLIADVLESRVNARHQEPLRSIMTWPLGSMI